jgi:hypothetical protein
MCKDAFMRTNHKHTVNPGNPLRAAFTAGVVLSLLLATKLSGCASSGNGSGKSAEVTRSDAKQEMLSEQSQAAYNEARLAADPVGYLRLVYEKARALPCYTLELTRSERRGLFRKLEGPERIQCWYRAEPHSIRMKWLDDHPKYGESTYVQGQNDNQVCFVPRNGFMGLPPSRLCVDVNASVAFGESRYSLTEFGLAKMLERTLRAIGLAGNRVRVSYQGLVNLDGDDRPIHYFRLDYEDDPALPAQIHELYIDAESDVPLGSVLRLRNGDLEASYWYRQVDCSVALTDEDFLLDWDRENASQ